MATLLDQALAIEKLSAPVESAKLVPQSAPRTDTDLGSRAKRARTRTVFVIAVIGLSLRVWHYAHNPSMWHDEAALVLNAIGKGFVELLGPLYFSEAAPPLFLWIERAASLTFGDSTLALRLVPFVASCAALLLVVWLARRIVSARAVPWAVLLFSVSDRLLWHCCEAKPYALDVFVAVLIPCLYFRSASWNSVQRIMLFTLVSPIVLFLVFPGCFVVGGVMLVLMADLFRKAPAVSGRVRSPLDSPPRGLNLRACMAYTLLLASVGISFLLLVLGPIRAQECGPLRQCWLETFPELNRPFSVPGWFAHATIEVIDYCCRPGGGALSLLAVIGTIALWRRRADSKLVILLAPLALAVLAALAHAYPFTGARVMVFAAPAVILLVSEGVATTLNWSWSDTGTNGQATRSVIAVILLGYFAYPIAWAAYRVVAPWDRPDFASASEFVLANMQPGDIVVGNSWEMLYYFRNIGEVLTPLDQMPNPPEARTWIVVTGKVPRERKLEIAQELAPGERELLQEIGFEKIIVLLKGGVIGPRH